MYNFQANEKAKILEWLERKFHRVIMDLGDLAKDKDSGVFRLWTSDDDGNKFYQTLSTVMGTPAPEWYDGTRDISKEKAKRLSSKENYEHISSWQSRNPDLKRYGGAIKIHTKVMNTFSRDIENVILILSFSGLPEVGDEALVLLLAREMGWLSEARITTYTEISGNELYAKAA